MVFTKNPHIQCNIEEYLHTASDHETVLSIGLKPPHSKVQFRLTPENTPRFAAGVKETILIVDSLPQDVDTPTEKIIRSIQVNLDRFLRKKRQIEQGIIWWNNECAKKAAVYRKARRQGEAISEKHAQSKATNTAPGYDGISTNILPACWDSIKNANLVIYQLCIRQGSQPRVFRTTEIISLPKPNRRDSSFPKFWRLIALLSCL